MSTCNTTETATPEPERKTLRGLDPEIQAMAKIATILDALSLPAAGRVLDWLQDRQDERYDLSGGETRYEAD